jgi:hypothetical protein
MVLEFLSLTLELEPAEHWDTKARLVKFGEIEVEGEGYTHDVVIDALAEAKRRGIEVTLRSPHWKRVNCLRK